MGAPSLRLPPPLGGTPDLLVVAGEHSGDEHAARMVSGLRRLRPGIRVAALGGPRLAAAGAQLLHDRTTMSVVGLGEVVRNLSFFRALIGETVRWISAHRPPAVCFVDNSGVNLRIAEALRLRGISAKGGGSVRTLYYISPQVWASRPGRRFDGHPFTAPDYRAPVVLDPSGPVLLLPGSRVKAVARIFPAILAGFRRFQEAAPGRGAVVLYPSAAVRAQLETVPIPPGVRLQQTGTPVAASAALTSSGTMSMHCALAGIPGAIAYRTDPFTYMMARWLVRVPYLGIANILMGEPMYPEYIQGAATPESLARELDACVNDPRRRGRTAVESRRLADMLARPPGDNEADWLLRNLP